MRKNCNEALIMPCSYAVMSEEEMGYVDGGSVSLPMREYFLNKSKCKNKAAALIKSGKVTGMSKQGIAEEIFAHAQIFFRAPLMVLGGVSPKVIAEIAKHAAVIDIEDGGDKWYRRTAYTAIWYGNPSIPV